MSHDELVKRVQIQEDRWSIEQNLFAWGEVLDRREWERMDDLYTQDFSILFFGSFESKGLEAFRASLRQVFTPDRVGPTVHNFNHIRTSVDGDEARCVCNYYAEHLGAGKFDGKIYTMWGEYDDTLRRTPEGWRISRRVYSTFIIGGAIDMMSAGLDGGPQEFDRLLHQTAGIVKSSSL